MKREGNLIGRIAEPDNLREAYRKAARGKAAKTDVVLFGKDLDMNLRKLRMQVLSGMVDVGNYTYFQIRDPKPRRICAAAFPERVLHHALMNVCHPNFERQLVETTYATRPGKGLYQALNRTRQAALKYRYVAKFDFRKYFDSIDHAVLERKLHRIFKDAVLMQIFHRIIDSYQVVLGKGLPIGNLTSQYYANFYLSSMDHRIKEFLRAPEYVRYMDDFLIFHSDRERLDEMIADVKRYSDEVLRLQLKPVVILRVEDGIPFCGYRIFPRKILLNGRSKRRLRRKMLQYGAFLDSSLWTEREYLDHIQPLLAFARFAYTKGLRRNILKNVQRTSRVQSRAARR